LSLKRKVFVSTTSPHFAKNVFFSCIDDRLVQEHLNFIVKIGGAFFPSVAGGGLAFVDPAEQDTALKQVAASYAINRINTVYIESHTDCGAYRLSGAVFHSPTDELARLYEDLDKATVLVLKALEQAGAAAGEVTVHTRVVNPDGIVQPRPQHAHVT
jgi:carbonic anhydrase